MTKPEVPKELPKLEEPQVEELDDLDLDDIDLTPRKSGLSKEASGGRTDAEIIWKIKKAMPMIQDCPRLLLPLAWLQILLKKIRRNQKSDRDMITRDIKERMKRKKSKKNWKKVQIEKGNKSPN